MWIWYLLLGSGSGSRTVGKFLFFFKSKVMFVVTAPTRSSVRLGWSRKEEEGVHVKSFEVFAVLLYYSQLLFIFTYWSFCKTKLSD